MLQGIADFGSSIAALAGVIASLIVLILAQSRLSKAIKSRESAENLKSGKPDVVTQLDNHSTIIVNSLSGASDVTDSLNGQKDLLSQYHSQSLSQSNISFWFSLIFAAIGFLVIISGIFIVLADNGSSQSTIKAIISIISGTVIDSVSALFFVQSNKSRASMEGFFDRLRTDKKLQDSLTLLKTINDNSTRDNLTAYLAVNLAGITIARETFQEIISSESQTGQMKTRAAKTAATSASV